MPRFFFHSQDGACFPDEQGTELSGLAAAQEMAVQLLSEQLKGNSELVLETGRFQVVVKDAQDTTVFTVNLTAAPGEPAGGQDGSVANDRD